MAGGLNLYGFVGGDPVNHSDPLGLFACPPDCGWEGDPRNVSRETDRGHQMSDRDRVQLGAMLVGGAALGAGALAAGAEAMAAAGVSTFFRGVSASEAAQVGADNMLKAIGGIEGAKFLTNSAEAAAEWGQRLHGEASRVVQVTVSNAAAKAFENLGRIDGIGNAWVARVSDLKNALVRILPK